MAQEFDPLKIALLAQYDIGQVYKLDTLFLFYEEILKSFIER